MGTPFIVTLVILIAVVLLAATIYNKLVRLRSAIGNAFAAGWHQQDSVVAVTRGALERLTRDELQGVVAHELSHNLHGNTRLNMRLIGYVYGLQMLFNYGRAQFGATDGHNRGNLGVVPGLALMAAGSAGWLAGRAPAQGSGRARHTGAAAVGPVTRRSVASHVGADPNRRTPPKLN